MGIDIYLRWDKMTKAAKQRQMSAMFKTTCGEAGYLREAYHGGPYATQLIFREAFEAEEYQAEIPAALMRERMDNVTEAVIGKDVGHSISVLMAQLVAGHGEQFNSIEDLLPHMQAHLNEHGLPKTAPATTPMTGREAIYLRYRTVYPDEGDAAAEEVVQSFMRFIDLAERQERKTGKPCIVVASY